LEYLKRYSSGLILDFINNQPDAYGHIFNQYYELASTVVNRLKLSLEDAHGGNIGIRPETGEYILFDVGGLTPQH